MKKFWMNKKVFVTGAGGFIGSHLVEKLIALGAEVTGLVHYNSRNHYGFLEHMKSNDRLEIILGDIQDYDFLNKCIKGKEYVFHLAALIGIPYSYVAQNIYIETNIKGSKNIFQACLDNNVLKVVHTSTSEVYGTAIYTPINENHPLQGQSPYSASKIAADMIAQSFSYSFGLPIAILRPFNTYGPRQSARAIIPTIISQMLTKNIVNVGSLSPKRDFNYVEDTVNGFLCLAESEFISAEVFNLSNGEQISIKELIYMIKKEMNVNLKIKTKDERKRPEKSEVMSLIGDSSKLQESTNWKSEYSLRNGLIETIKYIKNNIHLYNPEEYIV